MSMSSPLPKIRYWAYGIDKSRAHEGFLMKENEFKFIVSTGTIGVELHFPKSMYQFEYVSE